MRKRFIGRKDELRVLEERWRTGRPELIVVYGRRRVGKTELLLQFSRRRRKKTLYFLATQVTRKEHLRQFTGLMRTIFTDPLLHAMTFETWEDVFIYLGEKAKQERLLVVLDEFPYLVDSSPELPSVLQKFWDLQAPQTRIFLVLCGSHMGFMETEVLGEKSPLFGRRTAQILLRPFDYREAGLFFPNYTNEEKLRVYGMLGGMPAYLLRFSGERSLEDNLYLEMLHPQGFLYVEPQFLLKMELRDPRVYAGILGAIASGCTRLNEIAQRVGLPVQKVSKYLTVLQEMGLVAREVPFTARAPHRSKKGRYRIVDPYLNFWFRFVQPYTSLIESGRGKAVFQRYISPYFSSYMGRIFEQIARAYMIRYAPDAWAIPPVMRVGREWHGDVEIDVMAEHVDGSWSLGKCKWTRRVLGEGIYRNLREKTQQLSAWVRFPDRVRFFVFSTGPFSQRLHRRQDRDTFFLIGLEELFGTQ